MQPYYSGIQQEKNCLNVKPTLKKKTARRSLLSKIADYVVKNPIKSTLFAAGALAAAVSFWPRAAMSTALVPQGYIFPPPDPLPKIVIPKQVPTLNYVRILQPPERALPPLPLNSKEEEEYNKIVFWTAVVERHPENRIARDHLANGYFEMGMFGLALLAAKKRTSDNTNPWSKIEASLPTNGTTTALATIHFLQQSYECALEEIRGEEGETKKEWDLPRLIEAGSRCKIASMNENDAEMTDALNDLYDLQKSIAGMSDPFIKIVALETTLFLREINKEEGAPCQDL